MLCCFSIKKEKEKIIYLLDRKLFTLKLFLQHGNFSENIYDKKKTHLFSLQSWEWLKIAQFCKVIGTIYGFIWINVQADTEVHFVSKRFPHL